MSRRELDDLIQGALDQALTPEEQARLARMISDDPAARRRAAQFEQLAALVDSLGPAVVPHGLAGNILAKTLEYLAGATLAGVVLGAVVPIILTSRADPPQAHVASAAVSNVLFHRRRERHARIMV